MVFLCFSVLAALLELTNLSSRTPWSRECLGWVYFTRFCWVGVEVASEWGLERSECCEMWEWGPKVSPTAHPWVQQ